MDRSDRSDRRIARIEIPALYITTYIYINITPHHTYYKNTHGRMIHTYYMFCRPTHVTDIITCRCYAHTIVGHEYISPYFPTPMFLTLLTCIRPPQTNQPVILTSCHRPTSSSHFVHPHCTTYRRHTPAHLTAGRRAGLHAGKHIERQNSPGHIPHTIRPLNITYFIRKDVRVLRWSGHRRSGRVISTRPGRRTWC